MASKKYALSPDDVSRVIEMAWEDRTPFEAIEESYGLSESFLEKSDYVISFSALTFPHKLFKILLIEQLYRSITIIQNKSYHK